MEIVKSDMLEVLEALEKKGFKNRFIPYEGLLRCLETERLIRPEDLTIIGMFRFEGEKDMGDLSVIYVVKDRGDIKGLIIDSYGPYADGDLAECIRKIKVCQETCKKNLLVENFYQVC